jgi:predicted amidohydrolase YtcJ
MIRRSVILAGIFLASAAAAQERADLVLMNGRIYTADARDSVAQALAVKDGKFLAVGSNASIQKYVGAATKRIDLGGRFVTPGLADGHLHNEGGGPGVDLSQARTLAELLGKVGEAAKRAKAGDIIVTNNDWHEAQLKEKRLPLATEIDQVAPDNAVVLIRGGHEFILNSAALEKWNITDKTPVPDGGEISKGPDGKPNGELFDTARQLVQLGPRPPVSVEDILRTQRTLNEYGITAVRIPGSYRGNLFDDFRMLKQVKESGRLTVRFDVYLPGSGIRDPQRVHDMIVNSGLTQDEGDDWLKVGGVKLAAI